jgi:ABC-type arginine transport system ATPase subunit
MIFLSGTRKQVLAANRAYQSRVEAAMMNNPAESIDHINHTTAMVSIVTKLASTPAEESVVDDSQVHSATAGHWTPRCACIRRASCLQNPAGTAYPVSRVSCPMSRTGAHL